jgi:hypothetical protein
MENPEKLTSGAKDSDTEKEEIKFIRHSKSGYKSYREILGSDNPDQPLDIKEQVIPDISEAGIDLAKQEAEKLLSAMNPEAEALFFVSSDQVRALETAKIYKDISKEKGFTVITPEHHRNPMAEEMGDEEIRVVKSLSIKPESSLWSAIYNPPAYLAPINWEGIDPDVKLKWEKARQAILSDDKGNWGANFSHHSDILKEHGLLPNDQSTARELFETQFPQILRLARFGAKKAQSGFEGKKIRIIAFGHENYLAKAFEEYFGEEGINNCEVVDVDVNSDESITITRRGDSKAVEK